MRLDEAARLLKESGIEDSRREARLIFSRLLGINPALILIGNHETDSEKVVQAIKRRAAREPLQYILGEVYFYKEKYKVREGCLIPREDTELLVDYAVRNIPEGERFLDLCTGSGCIAISVLCNTKGTTAKAVDISSDALSIARENAELNGVAERVQFALHDALDTPPHGEEFFALVSNPPYVTEDEYKVLEPELYHEPRIALVGGEDGADFYRSIVSQYKNSVKPSGFMAFEIGRDQADILREIARENGRACEIIKDLSGNDRLAVLRQQ